MTAYSLLSGGTALNVTGKASMADMIRQSLSNHRCRCTALPELPPQITEIIDLALAKDPAHRWQSAFSDA